MSFIFYDCETTGVNRSFDQVLQFAAVHTDDKLNELETFEVRSRLLPYIAPSVMAIRANRISVHQLTDGSLPSHYQMVRLIREKLVSWSPAVFIGYNSIRFDEYMLRQAFYKTLHPPYLTNTNGNCRADAMRLIQAASVFAPNAILLPATESTEKSYRLDQVAPTNGFDHEHAHDAMADAQATVHLCRLLLDRAPDLWSSGIRLSRKPAILDFVETESVFSLTEFYYGKCYSWIVSTIGYNSANSNDIYVFNLGVAPESLVDLGEFAMRRRITQRPKPLRRIRANAAPILSPLDKAPHFTEGLELGSKELHRRANVLQSDHFLRSRVVAAFEAIQEPRKPSPHLEDQLYDAFYTDDDEQLMNAFHHSPWEERLSIIERFGDARLRELGYRLVHCERPDLLDETTRKVHSNRVARSLLGLDDNVSWVTLREAIEDANRLLEHPEGVELTHIREHRDFLQRRMAEAMRLTL
jgi:exodeoxyribonuclease-1